MANSLQRLYVSDDAGSLRLGGRHTRIFCREACIYSPEGMRLFTHLNVVFVACPYRHYNDPAPKCPILP